VVLHCLERADRPPELLTQPRVVGREFGTATGDTRRFGGQNDAADVAQRRGRAGNDCRRHGVERDHGARPAGIERSRPPEVDAVGPHVDHGDVRSARDEQKVDGAAVQHDVGAAPQDALV
jgi:hypothetical protein